MVNNITNINKMNSDLSPQLIEHKKNPITYEVGNPVPGWYVISISTNEQNYNWTIQL
jgi:hypothetical protein